MKPGHIFFITGEKTFKGKGFLKKKDGKKRKMTKKEQEMPGKGAKKMQPVKKAGTATAGTATAGTATAGTAETSAKSIESVSREHRTFPPPKKFSMHAHVRSMEEYEQAYRESLKNPDAFW